MVYYDTPLYRIRQRRRGDNNMRRDVYNENVEYLSPFLVGFVEREVVVVDAEWDGREERGSSFVRPGTDAVRYLNLTFIL
jgi:hypothetical protein